MLGGMFGGPLLYTMGTILYRNKPTYEYTVQGGKGITHNALGETQLTGTKSKEYRIDKDNWHGVIQNMTKEIQTTAVSAGQSENIILTNSTIQKIFSIF